VEGTLLGRLILERQRVDTAAEALEAAREVHPRVVLVDRDVAGAADLVRGLRAEPATRHIAVVVAARGDVQDEEIELLEAGANAVLRLPAGPEWDERLCGLLDVPERREIRRAVRLQTGVFRTPEKPVIASTLDLSIHGMRLRVPRPLPVGTELEFSLVIRENQPPVQGTCRIVRESGPEEIACRFEEFEGDSGLRLRRSLDR
jgi:CheY-like chemotaxis protein